MNRIYDYVKPVESGNQYKKSLYSSKLNYECANPYCNYGIDPEVHHIIPLSKGGEDKYYNYILLCHKCHRSSGVHSHFEFMLPILNDWKTSQELRILGFTLDEYNEKYHKNIKRLVDVTTPTTGGVVKPKAVEIKSVALHHRESFHAKKKRVEDELKSKSKNGVIVYEPRDTVY